MTTDQYIEDLRAQVDDLNGTLDRMREFLLWYSKENFPITTTTGKSKPFGNFATNGISD
jgi:hypothetical protein